MANDKILNAVWLSSFVLLVLPLMMTAEAASMPMESVGGTVMPFGGSSFGGDAEKAAERMRVVKERGRISRFVMSGIGSSVRVNGMKGPEAYTTLGRHIANVQRKVAADGIQIGFFMSPTLNCGINHPWAKFRNFDGTERAFTACPGEEGFRKDLAAKAAALAAEAHPFLYLMEDDFRYWGLGCFCGKHLRRFSEQTGVNRGREALVKALRVPGPEGQKLRMAWHRLQVSDLVATAKEVAAAVEAVSPSTRIGLCAPGGFPERETAEIARALAGKHRPVVRWYGSFYGYDYPVLTSGRLFSAQWSRENLPSDIEYMYEADPCPRTRFYASAARMEALISTTLASGFCLPLFQALLTREDALETAPDYLDMHGRRLDRFLAIKEEAAKGRLIGVQAWFDSDMRVGGMGGDAKRPLDPEAWFRTVNRFGMPVTMADAPVKLFAGHHTFRTMDDLAITNLLSGAVFLDGAAAEALTERGFASLIGVKATMRNKIDFSGEHLVAEGEPVTFPCAFHQNYGLDGCAVSRLELCGGLGISRPTNAEVVGRVVPNAPQTEIVTEFSGKGKRQPAITYFENELGGRVAVMAVNLAGCKSSNVFNFRKRDLLAKIFRELGGDRVVPARVLDRANVTLLANDDGRRLFLHAMYLSCDPADSFVFEVLPPYAGTRVEILDGAEWKPADANWEGTQLTVRPPSKVKVYGTLILRLMGKPA